MELEQKNDQCLFCKIMKREIPAEIVFENQYVIGFKDIHPIAKIHLLFIHRQHSHDLHQLIENQPQNLTEIFSAIKSHMEENKLYQQGYRVINNVGSDGGQTVFHTHFHVLAGEKLKWG